MSWNIQDKVVLVTGGASGIGLATATELATRGAAVTITSRSADKAEAAAGGIKGATGIDVTALALDLSELDSIDSFVERFQRVTDSVDVLINNAGTIAGKRQLTGDGLELTFASNYLGPFYLTNQLLPLLSQQPASRILNVSSELYRNVKGGLNLADLQLERGFSASKAYAHSKLALMLFTFELRQRHTDIESFAIHPGVIQTSFGTGPESGMTMSLMMKLFGPMFRKPDHGARSSVLLATAPSQDLDSSWYWSEGNPAQPQPMASDPEVSSALWELSEELIRQAKG